MGEPSEFGIGRPMTMRRLFEGPKAYLDKLHAHVTHMRPGAGYLAHEDEYDVGIIVFSGVVETSGKMVGPRGSDYYAASEPHGLRNVGKESTHYLVFEFHGPKPLQNGTGAGG